MAKTVGVMDWEEMNWLFPDYEDTGLVYHYTDPNNLASIFVKGLIPRFNENPIYRHESLYETLHTYRPDYVPTWVDPRKCVFGSMNRVRQDGRGVGGEVFSAILGIQGEAIADRTWVGCLYFSNMVYCPSETGYLDTQDRSRYYREVMEPLATTGYWKTSMSFSENRRVRLDQLLPMQEYVELLICMDQIAPEVLTLQALRVKGTDSQRDILREEYPDIFSKAETKLRRSEDVTEELRAIADAIR